MARNSSAWRRAVRLRSRHAAASRPSMCEAASPPAGPPIPPGRTRRPRAGARPSLLGGQELDQTECVSDAADEQGRPSVALATEPQGAAAVRTDQRRELLLIASPVLGQHAGHGVAPPCCPVREATVAPVMT